MKQIGDIIAGMTTKAGVEPCTPCKERQERMNQAQTNLENTLKGWWEKLFHQS